MNALGTPLTIGDLVRVNTHPAILESAAVAVKSDLAKDEVKICVILKPGASLSPEDLIRYANERMPHFAVPRYAEFMESLPKTPTERTQKFLLKQAGVTPHTRGTGKRPAWR